MVAKVYLALGIFSVILLSTATGALASPKTVVVYSGTVTDQGNSGLGGVVVYVATGTYSGYATTNNQGQWDVPLNGAGTKVTEDYYWNASTGPLLASVTLPYTDFVYNEKVTVWETSIQENFSFEYPHTFPRTSPNNDSVKFAVSNTVTISFGIQYSGSLSAYGFLNIGGSLGYGSNLTVGSSTSLTDYQPYFFYRSQGTIYSIEDASGNKVAYVEPYAASDGFSTANTQDYMTYGQALSVSRQLDINASVEVAGGANPYTYTKSASGSQIIDSALWLKASVPLFGSVSFKVEESVASGSAQSVSAIIYNSNTYPVWYLIWLGGTNYYGGFDMHVWYNGTSFPYGSNPP